METDVEIRRLLKAMRTFARAMDVHSARINRAVGLTLPQLVVLACIRDLGDGTGLAIAREAELSPPTVAGILDKLALKGLVERYRSETDRRAVHTRLTPLGEETLDTAPPLLDEQFVQGLHAIPEHERNDLILACERLARLKDPDRLELDGKNGAPPMERTGPLPHR